MLFSSLVIGLAFAQMFVFCNFGQKMSDQFSEGDNKIYQTDWYAFPREVQRMLPIIMMGAQEPIIFHGFGNLTCTREAFKKVFIYRKFVHIPHCVTFFIFFSCTNDFLW